MSCTNAGVWYFIALPHKPEHQPRPEKIFFYPYSHPTRQNKLLYQHLFLLLNSGYSPQHSQSPNACPWLPLQTCLANISASAVRGWAQNRALLAQQPWLSGNISIPLCACLPESQARTHAERLPVHYHSVFYKKTWISATRQTQKLVSYSLHSSIPLGTLCKGSHWCLPSDRHTD